MIKFREYFLITENVFRRKPYEETEPLAVGQILIHTDETGTRYAKILEMDTDSNELLIKYEGLGNTEWIDFNNIRTPDIQMVRKRYVPPGKRKGIK